jgi:hypothetical protein
VTVPPSVNVEAPGSAGGVSAPPPQALNSRAEVSTRGQQAARSREWNGKVIGTGYRLDKAPMLLPNYFPDAI